MSIIKEAVKIECGFKAYKDKDGKLDVSKDTQARSGLFNILVSDAKFSADLEKDFASLGIPASWIPVLAIKQWITDQQNAGRPAIRAPKGADELALAKAVQAAIDGRNAAMKNQPGETREVSEKTLAARENAKLKDFLARFEKGIAAKDAETIKVAQHIASNMGSFQKIVVAFYEKGLAQALLVK